MVSFSKLPCEIKENIFSKIRIRDLYEVSVVCEEWWWLTMRTYKAVLTEEDQLIKTLLDFCNREKKPSTPLMWFLLVKHGVFCDVKFDSIPGPLVLKHFLESRKQIRSLCLRTKHRSINGQTNLNIGSNETKLEDILKYFPHLTKLRLDSFPHLKKVLLHDFTVVPSLLKIPKRIQELHLTGIEVYGFDWSNLFEDPNSVQSLELDVKGLTFDRIDLKNLKRLSLRFETPLDVHQMKNILDLIRDNENLKSVNLVNAKITHEWFNLFGKTIENIFLKDISIDLQLLNVLGNDGCYERRVMSYVCSGLKTVKRFTLAHLSRDIYEDFDYIGVYSCKPQLMEEKLVLDLDLTLSRQVETITYTDGGPVLRDLHIKTDILTDELTNCVPASVKKFKLDVNHEFDYISTTPLFEQPENLEELQITQFSILPKSLKLFPNLKILHLAHVAREGIRNLLQHSVSLNKLTLEWPDRGCFTDLSPPCVNKTIREVNLCMSDASLEDILYLFPNLEVLRLSSHRIYPLSMPTGIAKLKLCSVTFAEISDVLDKNKYLVSVMNTVDVPCKLFYSDLDLSSFTFKFGWNDSLIDDFQEIKGYAYCSGISSRLLEALGIQILGDVNHFIDLVS